jgi:hypothetical protein
LHNSRPRRFDVHVDFPLFQRLALPIPRGCGKIPGIKLHDTRMLRLMEVLLHAGTKVLGWRTTDIHQAILASFALTPESYTLTQQRGHVGQKFFFLISAAKLDAEE